MFIESNFTASLAKYTDGKKKFNRKIIGLSKNTRDFFKVVNRPKKSMSNGQKCYKIYLSVQLWITGLFCDKNTI